MLILSLNLRNFLQTRNDSPSKLTDDFCSMADEMIEYIFFSFSFFSILLSTNSNRDNMFLIFTFNSIEIDYHRVLTSENSNIIRQKKKQFDGIVELLFRCLLDECLCSC